MATSLETHGKLTSWVIRNGGYLHPDVEIKHSPEKGFHVLVAVGKTVDAMTRIVSCPMPSTLSVLNAMDVVPFRCQGTRFPASFLRKDTTIVQNFFLMEQYILGDESWWGPYIATLPTPKQANELAFSSQEDLAWVEGTNLKAALATQTKKWHALFNEGMKELLRLKWYSAVQGHYSWELFQWAATMFGSRSFTSRVLADTLPADQARPIGRHDGYVAHQDLMKLFSDGFPVLLPLLDLLNYKPRARVEWQARYSFVGLQVLETFEGGQELCNNYGPRDNETLMLGYGFTVENNPFDHYSVALKIPPESPLAESRTWTAEPRSDKNHRFYIFNALHPRAASATSLEFTLFSYDLLDSLSVLSGNDRELQTMYNNQRTLISDGLRAGKFEDYRNVLSTMSQLLMECFIRESALAKTCPKQSPKSRKQRYAQTYRDNQLTILQTAVLVCKFVLIRASSSRPDDQVLKEITRSHDFQHASSSLVNLIQRHQCLTRPGELLSVSDLLDVMKSGEGLRSIVNGLEDRLASRTSVENLAKSQAAVILGALQVEFVRGNVLPQRLRLWIDRLTHWYPPEDPNWSYVPHAGPYNPGEDPPPMLMTLLKECRSIHDNSNNGSGSEIRSASSEMEASKSSEGSNLSNGSLSRTRRWLKPEVLCWGWNVMEEEGVRMPFEVVDETRLGSTEFSFLLYCSRV